VQDTWRRQCVDPVTPTQEPQAQSFVPLSIPDQQPLTAAFAGVEPPDTAPAAIAATVAARIAPRFTNPDIPILLSSSRLSPHHRENRAGPDRVTEEGATPYGRLGEEMSGNVYGHLRWP
jgi:hypothetical protein